ncbi:MAG TPA: DUF2911 domain-containing protein [Gemmatimonadaceae bacterium]|nr:DUF2911 domain-containing protein [Gemmatimonadaceae bacterium]
MRAIRMRLLHTLAGIVVLAASKPADCQEIRKSQLATISQMVGNTRIDIVYRRPVARGRELFGGIVPFGKVWSPSADSAALFTTSTDISIAGSQLKAGSYTLWMIPERETWTIIFSSKQPAFHLPYPQGQDVLRVNAASRAGDHMETLAFHFPMVDADSAVLSMHWGKTVVPLSIKGR